ncbi:MAG TPA: DUF5591 domain-containing protein [Candidatus Methanoperedenaceae archaeon]|nr:DUF5591 domain-containing protein [Candidatus Methanoperedenaceae archaeon]
MIIPEHERSAETLDSERIFMHPDMVRANEWVLCSYSPPHRDLCIFVPCSVHKPYHDSPSHRHYDRVIYSIVPPERVHMVVFGTCGVTPRELDTEYPFMNYRFMMGKCNIASVKREFVKTETQRLARYLEKTAGSYSRRIAYCMGDFREAMKHAARLTGIGVQIVPYDETLKRHMMPGRRFPYGSLSEGVYLRELADAICDELGLERRPIPDDMRAEEDSDWYRL